MAARPSGNIPYGNGRTARRHGSTGEGVLGICRPRKDTDPLVRRFIEQLPDRHSDPCPGYIGGRHENGLHPVRRLLHVLVEVAFELRKVTDHLIGSTSEIMAYGFPYARMGHYMFGEVDYAGICNAF